MTFTIFWQIQLFDLIFFGFLALHYTQKNIQMPNKYCYICIPIANIEESNSRLHNTYFLLGIASNIVGKGLKTFLQY